MTKTYKVRLIKEYITRADSKEEAIEHAKFDYDYHNDSSFLASWDKIQCREVKTGRYFTNFTISN